MFATKKSLTEFEKRTGRKNLSGGVESGHAKEIGNSLKSEIRKAVDSGSDAPPAQNNLPVPVLAEATTVLTSQCADSVSILQTPTVKSEARESTSDERNTIPITPAAQNRPRGGQSNSVRKAVAAKSPQTSRKDCLPEANSKDAAPAKFDRKKPKKCPHCGGEL